MTRARTADEAPSVPGVMKDWVGAQARARPIPDIRLLDREERGAFCEPLPTISRDLPIALWLTAAITASTYDTSKSPSAVQGGAQTGGRRELRFHDQRHTYAER